MSLDHLLETMSKLKSSDLYISVGIEPNAKVNGRLQPLCDHKLNYDETLSLVCEAMSEDRYDEYCAKKEANFALSRDNIGRFRVSAFWQKDNPGMVLRRIEMNIPTFEELALPRILQDVTMTIRGLVLFVGATGAGKSTTQAAMLGYRNQHMDGHILTIEDPIEFVHEHNRSIITQREVGLDTDSFDIALKNSLRQAPNVILIGEIRSQETMEYALAFAETGHLCMATLHANNANQAMDRIMHLVAEEKHRQLLFDLSFNLKAVVAQQLLPRNDGEGRVAAFEILLNTPLVSDLLRKGEMHKLKDVMTRSREQGMQTFDQALFDLYQHGHINYSEALAHADSPNDLRLMIKLSGDKDLDSGMLDNVTVDI
ncbi:PilT/PilU family type 4a pilus ATPase [Dongshaea marina]|uniref:PilT/PilU family type 4a pilus ATPase n=1 Tax=Dongshaea marina TaxID=2047966 RepID=UPI000D3E1725|nr:PilT/PilU family type 4a pilus ATPase [Dongshaea marina]